MSIAIVKDSIYRGSKSGLEGSQRWVSSSRRQLNMRARADLANGRVASAEDFALGPRLES